MALASWLERSVALLFTAAFTALAATAAQASDTTTIRVGYPVSTLINGQIGHVLANTDVLADHGLDGEVTGFAYGAPMMEAMAAGRIDVAFTTEGPAALLLTRDIDASVVATLGGARSGLLVPADSPVERVTDLEGATLAVPFGSTPHFHLVTWLRDAGLDPETDVNLINLETGELEPALAGNRVDAITYWEPHVTQLVRTIDARLIAEARFTFTTIMRRDFIETQRASARRFLAAMREATLFMATNHDLVNSWFVETSRASAEVIDSASRHTEVYAEASDLADIDLAVTEAVRVKLGEAADFMAMQRGVSASLPDTAVDDTLWQELLDEQR